LFIGEAVGHEDFMEVVAEIEMVSFFITNNKVLLMREMTFKFNFGMIYRVIIAKLFKIKDHAMGLYQRMHIKNEHLQDLLLQLPIEFIEASTRRECILLYERMSENDSGRMILNDETELFDQKMRKKYSGRSLKMNVDM
jgi:hypothetical protein